jgi:hypothetical protein
MIRFLANKIVQLCKQGYMFDDACRIVEGWRDYGK